MVVFLAGGLLLAVSYALLDGHLHNTLSDGDRGRHPAPAPGAVPARAVCGHRPRRAARLADRGPRTRPAARDRRPRRAPSPGDSLARRVALRGPDDELHELADTFDEMLERLDSAFASQKRFVANASHELRTPLTVLRTEVEVALADPDASAAELRATAEVVREEVQRFEALLESLLALARSEARALATEEPVDLADIARRVVARLQPEAAADDVRLKPSSRSARSWTATVACSSSWSSTSWRTRSRTTAAAASPRSGSGSAATVAALRVDELGAARAGRERRAAHRAVPPARPSARPARRRRGPVDRPRGRRRRTAAGSSSRRARTAASSPTSNFRRLELHAVRVGWRRGSSRRARSPAGTRPEPSAQPTPR